MDELTIIGNLGKDAELKFMADGRAVCQFSLASNRTWKVDEETRSHTTWYRCSLWGKYGEAMAQYLLKGKQVFVRGRLHSDEFGCPRIWNSDNGPRASFEVVVEKVQLLGGGRREDGPDGLPAGAEDFGGMEF